ncbi:MAG: PIN domain-containing protein [Pirellulaceae bacterium]|nr:PIN domain-containing protein [Pirellulaceae bacterium]
MNEGERSFIDTNVWLYAFLASQDAAKHAVATQIAGISSTVVSTQVVSEVAVNLIRKGAFTELQVRALIESFYEKCAVVGIDREVLLLASNLRERLSLSYWDSTIVAAALHAGANVLYTEDMQHGLTVDDALSIVNPFLQT